MVKPVVLPSSTVLAIAIFEKSPVEARIIRTFQPLGGGGPPAASNPTPPVPASHSGPVSTNVSLFQVGSAISNELLVGIVALSEAVGETSGKVVLCWMMP